MEQISKELQAIFSANLNMTELEVLPETTTEKRPLRQEEVMAILAGIGIPERYREAQKIDIDDLIWSLTDPYRWGKSEGLFLHGKPGRGKSYLAAALIRARIEAIRVPEDISDASQLTHGMIWVNVTDMLLEIKACFKEGAAADSEEVVIGKYASVKWLTLDDIGPEKTTDWVLQTLYTIIDRRYRDMRRTVITSNLSIPEIELKVGARIASRIAGMCEIIELRGKDRRLS